MKIKMLPAATGVQPIDFHRTMRHVTIPVDYSVDDILVPGAWGHIASKIPRGDEIVAIRADMAWRAHLLVSESGPGFLMVHALSIWSNPSHVEKVDSAASEGEELDAPENYTVNHAPRTGWRVWTKTPALEVSRNHKTRRDAVMAARAHYQRIVAVAA